MNIKFITEISISDANDYGNKIAVLGELNRIGIKTANGFGIPFRMYFEFVKGNNLSVVIDLALKRNIDGKITAQECSDIINESFLKSEIPAKIKKEIQRNYKKLKNGFVAVRSSANAEDLPHASFAGMQETYLNISGYEMLLLHIKKCWASLWSERAIKYRQQMKNSVEELALAVLVQEMVDPDISGVTFTYNVISNNPNEILTNSSYGLGEVIVSGVINPDTYIYDSKKKRLLSMQCGDKAFRYVNTNQGIQKQNNSEQLIRRLSLGKYKLHKLMRICMRIEKHFKKPQDIEWAIKNNKIYILQTRAITNL